MNEERVKRREKRVSEGEKRVERNKERVGGAHHRGAPDESGRPTKKHPFLSPLHSFLIFQGVGS